MKYYLSLFLGFVALSLQAQSSKALPDIDIRLVEVYDMIYLKRLQAEQPVTLERLNFELDHAYVLRDYVPGKDEALPQLDLAAPEDINILRLLKEGQVRRHREERRSYHLPNIGKVITLYAGKELVAAFNAHRGL